ncbi:MAG: hypothetical protein PHC99_10045 [Methylococcales bacterium]|nr:hypothetical protein [Methylococcales bacterium]
MTNQNKVIPFTFHGVAFNVVPTGNLDVDFNIGALMSVLYLKVQRDNYNEAQPLPPNKPLLPEIVLKLAHDADFADVLHGFMFALDMFLQPLSHAARNGLDHLNIENLIADIANPNLDDENLTSLKNVALNLGE